MNSLEHIGVIRQIESKNNLSIIFMDNSEFSTTGYKVIRNQESFVHCSKALLNGHIQLVYFKEGYKTIKQLANLLDGDIVLNIIIELLNIVLKIKENGFLFHQNLDMSPDHIFFDTENKEMKLIYVPLARAVVDADTFESRLCKYFEKLTEAFSPLKANKLEQLHKMLSDESLHTIEDIKGAADNLMRLEEKPLYLQSTILLKEREGRCAFEIMGREYYIGRKADEVDGVISFSKAVGRKHCKLQWNDHELGVIDLNSSNGTKINGINLHSGEYYKLVDGDVLEIADVAFEVAICH